MPVEVKTTALNFDMCVLRLVIHMEISKRMRSLLIIVISIVVMEHYDVQKFQYIITQKINPYLFNMLTPLKNDVPMT